MNQLKNRILLVEDDAAIRKCFSIVLDPAEYDVVDCENGQIGIRNAATLKPDLVVLDMGLPDISGTEVLRSIREWSQVPVIVCTANSDESDILGAFEAGADDYVTKPFSPAVMAARIAANLRKAAINDAGAPELVNGPLRVNLVRHEVFLNDVKISLTPKEFALLRYLLVNRGKMLTHRQILKEIWGPAQCDNMQYLRVYVSHLREKFAIGVPDAPVIVTEAGIGYRLEVAA